MTRSVRDQAEPSQPRAKAMARHTSRSLLSLSCAIRRPRCAWATVTKLWRFTAQGCFIPSSVPSGTSDGTPRTVDAIGATVTRDKYRIADPRVRIKTGRSLSGGANRYSRISPALRHLMAGTLRLTRERRWKRTAASRQRAAPPKRRWAQPVVGPYRYGLPAEEVISIRVLPVS